MAGSGVSLYATTAAGNKTVIGTIDWREDTYLPNQINDNVAQIMADIRAMANAIAAGFIEIGDGDGTYTATYVSATSFRFDGVNVANYYRVGARVRVEAPTPVAIIGTITNSVFSTHTTLTILWDAGSLSNEAITAVQLIIGSGDTTNQASATTKSYRNIMGRNGGLEVWQRGSGGSYAGVFAASTSTYTADGWLLSCGTDQASSVVQLAGIANGSRYCGVVQRNAGQVGVSQMGFEYPFDTDEIAAARGSILTLSLMLQAGATWSPTSGNIAILLHCGTGPAASRAAGAYTSETTPLSVVQALTTTATRYTFTSTAVIPTTTTQASLRFLWTPVGTAGATDWFAVDDAMLELGGLATAFERRPFESELLACYRHYFKTFQYDVAPAYTAGDLEAGFNFAQPVPISTGIDGIGFSYPVAMRSAPTIVRYNPAAANGEIRNVSSSTDWSGCNQAGTHRQVRFTGTTPGGAAGAGARSVLHFTADAGI